MSDEKLLNHIKNDLRRVAKWAGEIDKPFPKGRIDVFLQHALKDFNSLSGYERVGLRDEFDQLVQEGQIDHEPLQRLRWAEKTLTLSCRL
ncbi:hypothetical protein KKB83_02250 [Patescibacteria group bacterium]|nr:hypothetical protein [Patescibacteria group bacterium]